MREKQEEVLKTERSVWEGRCVGRQKGSEDVRSAGERGGCSSSEVFTRVDTGSERHGGRDAKG